MAERDDLDITDQLDDEPTDNRQQMIDDLIATIKESADKMASDGSSRGDLKILSRTMRELRYAFKVFAPYRRRRKVTVFGSARTKPDHPAYQQAVRFGRAMADQKWLVVTGAASGIMHAAHEGAGRENSMGINIMLPFEQEANPIIAGDPKLVHMKYFFTRKLMFVKECDAVVCLPGGFGTLDEALEVLTLLQTGKRDMAPVVLLDEPGGDYWQRLNEFIIGTMLHDNLIAREDLHLYKVTDDCQAAVDECLKFFSNYHSLRYCKKNLVLRMHQPLDASRLDEINANFGGILSSGNFKQTGPRPEESNEPELAGLSRLVFHFNRRNLGRLRQLIDIINGGAVSHDRVAHDKA